MKILSNIIQFCRCINCSFHCVENLGLTYCYHGRLDDNPKDPCYPKINKTCCPKKYPLSIYLRNLAGVWNNNYEVWMEGSRRKIIAKFEENKQ